MRWAALLGLVLVAGSVVRGGFVSSRELGHRDDWEKKHLESPTDLAEIPFTFAYAGRPSAQVLGGWKHQEQRRDLDAQRQSQVIIWTDRQTGLQVRCEAVSYRDFPTIEWTLYFRNTSKADTPILSNIRAIDLSIARGSSGEFVLHHNAGSQATPDDYRPLTTPLPAGKKIDLASNGGRGSDGVWPYFNIAWPDEGCIVAVGWPGQWAGGLERQGKDSLHVFAGQQQTHFKLLPGEEVRSPLIVLEFYEGDWVRGQNIWRRWMIAHNIPRLDGKLPPPMLAGSSANQLSEMQHATEENQKQFLDGYFNHGVHLGFWWMDAGWYPFKAGWWNVGTWEPDPKRFPHGLRAVSDRTEIGRGNLRKGPHGKGPLRDNQPATGRCDCVL